MFLGLNTMDSLHDDLFIIPIDNGNIIYSPRRRGVFWADDEAAADVERYIEGESLNDSSPVHSYLERLKGVKIKPIESKDFNDGSDIVVILSQRCNLACSYCYAQESRSHEVLDINLLKFAILEALNNTSKQHVYLTFIGGGEPLIEWDSIKGAILFAEENKGTKNIFYSITTNLTLLNNDILDFAKKYNVKFGVSFEILKDIQDKQRPFHVANKSSFDIVHKNIIELIKRGLSYNIRSTITDLNVSRMPEMVRFVGENYPGLRKVHFEQVTDPETNGPAFYNEFINYFMIARETGRKYNINVYNSISNSIYNIKDRFCRGEFCITPTGSIVACHRLSSKRDINYDLFHIGDIVEDKGVIFSGQKIKEYLRFSNEKRSLCNNCFAIYHCAGICPMERSCLTERQIESKCDFTRSLIKRLLTEFVNNQ